ncbi:hypothetical protein ACWD0J_06420 [Streptomyces sp. NPDC003011]
MRSTRMLLATAAASAVLAITAPGAYAGDWDHEDSSYSKEHDKYGKHDTPRGGMHTGGGALTAVNEDEWGTARDPKHDPETYKDPKQEPGAKDPKHDSESYKDSEHEKDSYNGEHEKDSYSGDHEKDGYGGDHDKPRGGVHTGGGALASPGVTAGGLAVLAVAGTGLYAVRRNRSAHNAA